MRRLRVALGYALVVGLVTGVALWGAVGIGALRDDEVRAHLLGATRAVDARVVESESGEGRCSRRNPSPRREYLLAWSDAEGRERTATLSSCTRYWAPQEMTIWVPRDAQRGGADDAVADDPVDARSQSPWEAVRWRSGSLWRSACSRARSAWCRAPATAPPRRATHRTPERAVDR